MNPRTLPRRWLAVAVTALTVSLPLYPARSQAPPAAGGADVLANDGKVAFDSGDYATAAAKFGQILKDHPTSQVVPTAQLYGGYANFLLGQFDAAIEVLKKATGLPATEDIQEIAQSLLPQAMAAKASAMGEASPQRTQAFLDAIAQFDTYLKRFPGKEDAESVQYGRALSYFQIGRYADAIKDLQANLQQFPTSRSLTDSQYLLALTLAAQANKSVSENPAKRAEAAAAFGEAEKMLNTLIQGSTGVIVANDARFQLGEIAMSRAALESDNRDAQTKRVREALRFYRMVEPKETVIQTQEARLAELAKARFEAGAARNMQELQRIRKYEERERGKLEQIKARPDQTLSANLKAAESFFLFGDYDAARVAFTHLGNFLDNDDQKKTALYYRTMTYAVQNLIPEAMKGYEEFQTKFKGDPMAENLPVAIGSMYLSSKDPKVRDPQKAIDFFTQAMEQYPKGRFVDLAVVQKATAQIGLGKFEEALKTFQDFVSTHPDAKSEVLAQAQLGIANIYKETRRWDEAVTAYRGIAQKFTDQPEAVEQATFWAGWSLFQKGDIKGGMAELSAYLDKYPQGKLAPVALFTVGQGHQSAGQLAEAVKVYESLAEKFPDSEPATFSYFQRAKIHADAKDTEALVAVMRAYIGKYPKEAKVFYAYDSIGQSLMNARKIDEALATYRTFADKYPEDPNAPKALVKASELARTNALAVGRNYVALSEEQRAIWTEGMDASIRAASEVIDRFPKSDQVSAALGALLETEKLRVAAGIATPEDIDKFIANLAKKHEGTPEAAGKIQFAHASFVHGADSDRSYKMMAKAYKPGLLLATRDLDLYGQHLIETGKLREAEQVYRKLGTDYPNPPNIDPKRAPITVMDAQATMLFGLGAIAQKEGKVKEGQEFFTQLKTLYSWSPKMLEANFGIAQALKSEGKNDEALALLVPIIRSTTSPQEIRAQAMLMAGHIYKNKNQPENAIDSFIKIAAFYEGVPTPAAEGLWEGAQLIEQLAAGISDPKKKDDKATQLGKARKAYEELIRLYPTSPNITAARQRLQNLGSSR